MGALDGQVAIVTGAGSGIGREVAIRLGDEGAALALAGRRTEPLETTRELIEKAGGRAAARPTDVGDAEQARALVAWAEAEFGRVDVLVNNAGVNSAARTLATTDVDTWNAVFAVNVTGPLALSRAVLPGMLQRGDGTIITVSSLAAINPGPMAGAAYSASKAAVTNLMGSLNAELRGQGIRACTVFPGEADTDILEKRALVPDAAARATMMRAEDVAAAVVFCATMPPRTLVEQIYLRPTVLRDRRADVQAALER